jgi:phosphoribosyl-ATP pyrophosphohydrolase
MCMEKRIVEKLYALIKDRKNNPTGNSYTSRLFEKGKEEILKKVVEECFEVIAASKDEPKDRIISEIADLTYHTLVLMAEEGVSPEEVYAELESRFGRSGLKREQQP